jgi:hypothetical protein
MALVTFGWLLPSVCAALVKLWYFCNIIKNSIVFKIYIHR